MSLTQPSSMRRIRLTSARPSSSLRRTVTQTHPLFILSEEEKAFLKTHFETDYKPLFMKWFLQTSEQNKLLAQAKKNSQTSEQKNLLAQKADAKEFTILSFPELAFSDKVLLENEKKRIQNIIKAKGTNSKDADVINDFKLLLEGDDALIIMHAKSRIYEGWQDLVNLKVMKRF